MLLSSIFSVALIPLALASPLAPRAAADILSGIAKLSSDIDTLQATVSTLKANDIGTAGTALKVQSQSKTIENDLSSLITTTQKTGNLNDEDTGNVASAVVNLEPNIKTLLNTIVQKKPAFATGFLIFGDLSKTVLQSLQNQRKLTSQFATTLTPKLAEPYKTFAPQIAAEIDGYFATAISAYQKCTGLVCLPPIPS